MVAFHFTTDEAGIPIPAAEGPAPRTNLTFVAVEERIAELNDNDAVRNIQHAFGYYVDQRMWDDVVDLFCDD